MNPQHTRSSEKPQQPQLARRSFLSTLASTAVALPLLHCSDATRPPPEQLDAMRRRRRQAAQRRRRIIFNNDSDDALFFRKEGDDISTVNFSKIPQSDTVTPEAFLDIRIAPIVGTHVDSLFYSDGQSFGAFLHPGDVSELFTKTIDLGDGGPARNITQELIEQGTSPLEVAIEFCHQNGIEIFSSIRMNDIHDGAAPVWFRSMSQFKKDHPEYLFGPKGGKLAYGYYSGVDYAQPAVREHAFRMIEDVCRGYDVDGLEMDFWRHPPFFKSYGVSGNPVPTEERDQMTELLLRRVRTMTEEVSLDRDRPLLIAVRVPDSVGACRSLGLDLERWLQEGLIDVLIAGEVQLTPWEETVALGHKYDVPVYLCIRPAIAPRRGVASTAESYRAVAMNIWNAGADGVYTFNMFKTRDRIYRELGDPETLQKLDKVYRLNPVGYSMAQQHFNADPFLRVPVLSPRHPSPLKAGQPTEIRLPVGDNVLWGESEGIRADVKLRLQVEKLTSSRDLTVKINAETLGKGALTNGWLQYDVEPKFVKQGANRIEITSGSGLAEVPILSDLELQIRYPIAE